MKKPSPPVQPDATLGELKNAVGREREFAAALNALEAEGQTVVHLHGIPGIGKSTFLQALVARLQEKGRAAVALDGCTIEPTPQGLLRALREAGVASKEGGQVRGVVALDNYEHLQLLDAWIRKDLLPQQPMLRLLFATRRLPHPAWMGSAATFLSLRLDELARQPSLRVLEAGGLSKSTARRAYAFTHGHPMALRLVIASGRELSHPIPDDFARHQVMTQLSDIFLADMNSATRQALEAMSTVRRTTQTMLAAMLEMPEAEGLYGDLRNLSIVERCEDGLRLHPSVQESIAAQLRAADPVRFTGYRRRAWRALDAQASEIGASDLWRHTADVIYLIENPVVREAFFPSQAAHLAVECARPEDESAILRIAAKHDGASGRAILERWWKAMPGAFHVVWEPGRKIVGFYFMFDLASAPSKLVALDPQTRGWQEHLQGKLDEPRQVLFLRRWLAEESGETPSVVQAACWLDIKRVYVELRPGLQRVYLAVADLAPYAPAATELGFEVVCAGSGLPLASAMLDLGPGSVDAWLRRLVRKELRIPDSIEIDVARREAVIAGKRVLLAPLECGVLNALIQAEGAILRREQIMEAVWGDKQYQVGSNVLEVVVLSLRRKLAGHAKAIVSVRGVGYRYCEGPRSRTRTSSKPHLRPRKRA